MKAYLMHRDADFDLNRELPPNHEALIQDLELSTLFNAMAAGDPLLFQVAQHAVLLSLQEPEEIVYRQEILRECQDSPEVIRGLYELAGEALQAERSVWGGLGGHSSPRYTLSTAVRKMEILATYLRRLREAADQQASRFQSAGLSRFFAMLGEELEDEYLAGIDRYLKELSFKNGLLMSARLSKGNKGTEYTLRRAREQGFFERILDRSGYSFTIADRDEAGARMLGELEDRATNLAANALAQAVEHVLSFFIMLRIEIGFYVACLNLSDRLSAKQEPTGFPVVSPRDEVVLSAQGLYDVSLTLTVDARVVGNDVNADGKSMVMITGANQGGKSTFLRAVGQAQLMSQCGMFVAAKSLTTNACDGLFTHYKREEDETMESGKLDEELSRMSAIADQVRPHAMVLCNESFASTNEREGSEIARQVVDAFLQGDIKVLFVTHMFDLAHSYCARGRGDVLFLRAERGAQGARPFKLREGEPLPTSYGEDSYRKVFGKQIESSPAAATGYGSGSSER